MTNDLTTDYASLPSLAQRAGALSPAKPKENDTMITEPVSESTFRDAFQRTRPDNFSREGLGLLFDYLEELSDETGKPLELDVIAICCDYSEMSAKEIRDAYGLETTEEDDEEDGEEDVRDYLNENTLLVGETGGSFVFAQF